ncbi:MAG TPA: 4a-hydroxytetrahydrobiopterin dehydratase [Candidatus Kapabacteria bacterium]|jgi:4a-hydroxytetrahydrobiopterin dehydratase|nr:4a-hydroxytetrahydrobiopterin dehydratase [Candidatus Kapabacteria bacterium]
MERTPHDRFTDEQIRTMLSGMPGWEYNVEKVTIEKNFVRKNFLDASAFIQQIAEIAEQHDHHPDLLLWSYKNVRVMLSTHSAKGVTQNDFDLARAIDKLS